MHALWRIFWVVQGQQFYEIFSASTRGPLVCWPGALLAALMMERHRNGETSAVAARLTMWFVLAVPLIMGLEWDNQRHGLGHHGGGMRGPGRAVGRAKSPRDWSMKC